MATSGTFNTTAWTSSQGLGTRYLTFSWTRTSTSVANNTSTIHYELKGGGTYDGTDYGWVRTRNVSLKINGETVYSSGSGGAPSYVDLTRVMTVTSGDFTITHNADGTKTFSAEVSAGIESTSNVKTGSGSWALDPIARKSDFTITPPNFTVGDTVAVNINRANTNFTHKIYIGSDQNPIATGVGTSYSWNTSSLLSRFASNSSVFQGSLKVVTMNGSATVGDVTHQFTATMPENADTKPTVSISAVRHPGDVPSGIAFYIQNRSRADVSVTASAKNGATISSYRVELDGKVYTSAAFTSDVITSSGSLVAKVTVTDSRGFTNTAYSGEIIVRGYYDPSLTAIDGESAIRVFRANASGTPDNAGDYVMVKVKRKYAPTLLAANVNNTAEIWWRRRETGASWQDDWAMLLPYTDPSDEYNALIRESNLTPIVFDTTKSYNVELLISDEVGTESSIVFGVPPEATPLHLAEGGTGVGLGAYALPTPNSVRVGWDTYFDSNVYIYDEATQDYITLARFIQNVINP